MSQPRLLLVEPRFRPPIHPGFRPASLGNRAFHAEAKKSGSAVPLVIGLQRNGGASSIFRTEIFPPSSPYWADSVLFADRTVKFLLWQKGGATLTIGGPAELADYFRKAYAPGGSRAFDAGLMARIYERPFTVVGTSPGQVPPANEPAVKKGGHLDGCRIGFDAGASDRKVAAVIDGKAVYSEEVIWHPKDQADPQYHYDGIMAAMKAAASHMPRVDAIGVSSAGVYVDNRIMVASLFRGVSPELFEKRVKGMFLDIQKAWNNIPMVVVNDGDVTALAGAMSIKEGAVLGIAMGSSEAAGYVAPAGTLTDWLSELAFGPVDYDSQAPMDEWSKDIGVGSQYFSQQAAIRLAVPAGIPLDPALTPAEKLKAIQDLMEKGDKRAADIFTSIGIYLGYAVPHYAEFYDFRHMLILGRVTSGKGGELVMDNARRVMQAEFPELAGRIAFHLPEEESERRVGQAIAAASLPERAK